MVARISAEQRFIDLAASDYEKKVNHLKRFLKKQAYEIEAGLNMWEEWVRWRHANEIDQIQENEIEHERRENIFAWRGKNKEGMKCLVVTGRNLDPSERKGSFRSFKRHLLKVIDEGLMAVDDDEQDQICILYDRRGLEFEHIDPNLYQFCRKASDDMRYFYENRVGALYILELNWLYWIFYRVVISPAMALLSATFHKKFFTANSPADLLAHFHEEDLQLCTDLRSAIDVNRAAREAAADGTVSVVTAVDGEGFIVESAATTGTTNVSNPSYASVSASDSTNALMSR
eukprot:CAMPEP_0174961800 /NCGR_PEP_ID=MMETSP0004_2-20121128/4439_1 /TAXON_ID=420556 /ORGANISM="Ochromonas sp., Strain CCMP1393" /LENGTH=287 /DNA_ID=CAMNT_0016210281 /DNA_START=162 /DNA_END=1025 /DNA_ORIENTATION=+